MSTTPPAPPTPEAVGQRGGGFAVAALVLGIVGVVFGFIPLLFVIAFPCGLLAVIFGVLAWRSANKPGGSRKGMAIAGTILGVVALALGVIGAVIVDDAVTDLDRDLDRIERDLGDSGGVQHLRARA